MSSKQACVSAQDQAKATTKLDSAKTDSTTTDEKAKADDKAKTDEATKAGHSFHGEAFNEGPRSAAYLMPGMANINFPITSDVQQVQEFFNQGLSQLHGFWYYEAERSFRQAAMLDPKCAMAYWGMAMSNVENLKRAREFIKQANERKSTASRREQMYIAAYEKFCKDKDDKGKDISGKTRAQSYTGALEEIVLEFPDDIEAKALLGGQMWANERNDLPILGHVAINALLQQVFDANSMHPAHHYRIHLWDRKKADQALKSSAMCGPSSPGIAHMWHMPGHIYSKLNRYNDAVWQQEASARVDHAHMMRDRVMPDQIHNFAHNNEWLIRNLIKIGRVADAVSLAKNMIELPRHPKYNTLKKSGSAKYGRERLFQTLYAYHLWDDIIQLTQTHYLSDIPDDEDLHLQWSRYLGIAQVLGRSPEAAQPVIDELEDRVKRNRNQLDELAKEEKALIDKPAEEPGAENAKADVTTKPEVGNEETPEAQAERKATKEKEVAAGNAENEKRKKEMSDKKKSVEDKRKKIEDSQRKIEKCLNSINATIAATQKRYFQAIELAGKGEDLDFFVVEWQLASGNYDKAAELVKKKVTDLPNEILPLALQSWIELQHGGPEAAKDSFTKLRELSTMAEIQTPPLARLRWLAESLGYSGDWRQPYKLAEDVGARPALDTLGPYRWSPYQMPELTVQDLQGQQLQITATPRPILVIFYLGFGCLHCVEQLKAFNPKLDEIRKLGIDVMAISSETGDQIQMALKNYDQKLDIPLHITQDLSAFKIMRCYDDFENQPLHGLFLLIPAKDGQPTRVAWQDISFEPFMDVDFAISESQRLIKLAN
ncbi:MAG: redoxin domain-containing protein [Pirellulales bacterium]